jgi:hypothetical protein
MDIRHVVSVASGRIQQAQVAATSSEQGSLESSQISLSIGKTRLSWREIEVGYAGRGGNFTGNGDPPRRLVGGLVRIPGLADEPDLRRSCGCAAGFSLGNAPALVRHLARGFSPSSARRGW